MAVGKLYKIDVENKPSGKASVYVDDHFVVSYVGPHAIKNAADYISKLQEKDRNESTVKGAE